jgi:hypothetical protein
LSSRIKKIALATANEPKASATAWLEDADLPEAAQAARAELEAEREAKPLVELGALPHRLRAKQGACRGQKQPFPRLIPGPGDKDRGPGGLQASAIGNN